MAERSGVETESVVFCPQAADPTQAPSIPTFRQETADPGETDRPVSTLIRTFGDDSANIVISSNFADVDRVLDVQQAVTHGFATTPTPCAQTVDASPEVRVAPFTHVPKRTARYRIPRGEKGRLLDGFCGLAEHAAPRTLLIVAHPDDESIGAGARLSELGEAWVTYVTDGAPRNPDVARRHACETRAEYAERRQREALEALSLAGIGADRVSSLGIVDGEASQNLVDLCLRIADLLDRVQPTVVVTHPYEGGHTDHDATAFAVHLACGILRREGVRPPAVFEMTSYNAASGERVVQEFLPHRRADLEQRLVHLGRDERLLKERMYACFHTQQRVLSEFSTAIEKFRPAPRYVFTRPPHEGVLNYERYGEPDLGRRFRAEAEDALRELRLRRRAG